MSFELKSDSIYEYFICSSNKLTDVSIFFKNTQCMDYSSNVIP